MVLLKLICSADARNSRGELDRLTIVRYESVKDLVVSLVQQGSAARRMDIPTEEYIRSRIFGLGFQATTFASKSSQTLIAARPFAFVALPREVRSIDVVALAL